MKKIADSGGTPTYSRPCCVSEITSKQNQQQAKDRALHLTDLDQRLKDMDRQGIDMQLLIPVPFQAYYAIRNDRGHRAIQIINNTLSKTAEKKPDRFLALGTLPMQDGDAAARLRFRTPTVRPLPSCVARARARD